jgi:hypothetical protein
MISNDYHIDMRSNNRTSSSPKPTLSSTHPRFTSTLMDILFTKFKSIRRFAELADIHPTYFYSYLRDGNDGVIPRFDTATNLMRTVKTHAPDRFESLIEALRHDIEGELGPDVETLPSKRDPELPPSSGFTEEELARIFVRAGWKLPRPCVAKRFPVNEIKDGRLDC